MAFNFEPDKWKSLIETFTRDFRSIVALAMILLSWLALELLGDTRPEYTLVALIVTTSALMYLVFLVFRDKNPGPSLRPEHAANQKHAEKSDTPDSSGLKAGVDKSANIFGLVILFSAVAISSVITLYFWSNEAILGAGSFNDMRLLDNINKHLSSNDAGAMASKEITIVSDWAAYGGFSQPEFFRKYKAAIMDRATTDTVTIVVQSEAVKRKLHEIQYPRNKFENWKIRSEKTGKFTKFFQESNPRKAMADSGIAAKIGEPTKLTYDDWLKVMLRNDELAMIQFDQETNISVMEYSQLLPIHIWVGRSDAVIFSFVDLVALIDEKGFFARGEAAEELRKLTLSIVKDSDPVSMAVAYKAPTGIVLAEDLGNE